MEGIPLMGLAYLITYGIIAIAGLYLSTKER